MQSPLNLTHPTPSSSLGKAIGDKLEIKCINDDVSFEIFRGIRSQMSELFDAEVSGAEMKAMQVRRASESRQEGKRETPRTRSHARSHARRPSSLFTHAYGRLANPPPSAQLGLSHSLSRYKLKFSPDKVDTMIVQAIGLLDDLDKEINMYAMRVKEWYGWHFPELAKVLQKESGTDQNTHYALIVKHVGLKENLKDADLSTILPDDVSADTIQTIKDMAEISMGTEIAEMDILNIRSLAEQVLSMSDYRSQLWEYLKNRMNAIAPNLTIMVGELVGARLISHAGSLMNLAKHPASTLQILGAEKALFRALKTKHDTPK